MTQKIKTTIKLLKSIQSQKTTSIDTRVCTANKKNNRRNCILYDEK